ncbi:MAG: SDR family NAD(P)-dependent oxidoreductase [Hyphomonadaceae bacterium]
MAGIFDLTGKNVVITGASRGIGAAMALRMAEQGANVVISSSKQADCEKVAAEINKAVGRNAALGVAGDLASKASLQGMIDKANNTFGQIDVLVCNAAIADSGEPLSDVSDEAFLRVIQVNILANHWLAQMVAPQMIARNDGAIIITSSIGALRGNPNMGPYAISKAGDLALVRSLARELGKHNIRVNAIAPGFVKTELSRNLWENPKWVEGYVARAALGRIGEPDDLSGIAVYLASRAGAWTTGQTFIVDGGAMA